MGKANPEVSWPQLTAGIEPFTRALLLSALPLPPRSARSPSVPKIRALLQAVRAHSFQKPCDEGDGSFGCMVM